MEHLTIAEQLIRTTVKIKIRSSGDRVGFGTGFYFAAPVDDHHIIPLLVSNRHILDNQDLIEIGLTVSTIGENGQRNPPIEIRLPREYARVVSHPNPEVDLSALLISNILQEWESIDFVPLTSDLIPKDWKLLDAIEELIMVGYPNGHSDKINNRPIVRRGITATSLQEDFNGQKVFLADIAVFGGSSGSPIFIYNPYGGFERHLDGSETFSLGRPRLHFVGIQSRGFLYNNSVFQAATNQPQQIPGVYAQTFMDLAVAEKSCQLFPLIEAVKAIERV